MLKLLFAMHLFTFKMCSKQNFIIIWMQLDSHALHLYHFERQRQKQSKKNSSLLSFDCLLLLASKWLAAPIFVLSLSLRFYLFTFHSGILISVIFCLLVLFCLILFWNFSFFLSLCSCCMIRICLLFDGIVLIEFWNTLRCTWTSVYIYLCLRFEVYVYLCVLLTHTVFVISAIQMEFIVKSMQLTKGVRSSKSEQ